MKKIGIRSFAFRIFLLTIGMQSVSCNKEFVEHELGEMRPSPITRAIVPKEFDWENAEWMPTPPGQTRIPSPWIGQGSLTGQYGIEIINDRKKKDGWKLLYSTFDVSAPVELINPYFALYNIYRGTLRIYIYINIPFIATSSYLQDALYLSSPRISSMLNFLGKDMVDASKPSTEFMQIQPAPTTGVAPLGAYKWYMMEYNIAYDPALAQIPYNDIQHCWSLGYIDVSKINMSGSIKGTLNGLIGSSKPPQANIIKELKSAGKAAGVAVLSGIGTKVIKDNTINEKTGENRLGLPDYIFRELSSGVLKAFSSGLSQLPKIGKRLLSAVFGGTGTGPTAISFSMEANMTLEGEQTSQGSFPSTPISFWVPGTAITADAIGYLPLYNKCLGVINFDGKPDYVIPIATEERYEPDDPFDPGQIIQVVELTARLPKPDYADHLIVNPEVLKIANVTVEKQELVVKSVNYKDETFIDVDPSTYWCRHGTTFADSEFPDITQVGVRMTIKVAPKNGNQPTYIVQTFELNDIWSIDDPLYYGLLPKR